MSERPEMSQRPEAVQTAKNATTTWIKQRLANIVLGASAFIFIFKEAIDFSRTEKDFLTAVMSIGLTYFFAVYVALAMRQMGKKSGKDNEAFIAAKEYMGSEKKSVKEITYLLPVYCRYKNDEAIEEVRHAFLEENGINMKLYTSGYYDTEKGRESLTEREAKVIETSKFIKIDLLTPSQLLSENGIKGNKLNPNYIGKTERELDRNASLMIAFSKLVFPVITGYFAVSVALGVNLIWGAIQTAIIMLMGVMQYMAAEDEVLTLVRNRYIMKGDYLNEFRVLYTAKPELFKEAEQEVVEAIAEPTSAVEEMDRQIAAVRSVLATQ
jgi:hypothetical protein